MSSGCHRDVCDSSAVYVNGLLTDTCSGHGAVQFTSVSS